MSSAVIILIFIEFEGITLLLYRVVSQMHKEVIYILRILTRWLEFFGCKTRKTLLKNKDTQGIHSID